MIKLSIIIPAYNAEPYIHELIDRLEPQITDEIQVIVIDDGSNKKLTIDKLWVELYHNKTNRGISYTRNKGLEKAKGELIHFIDADDLVAENYISYIFNLIQNREFDYIDLSWKSMYTGVQFNYKLDNINDRLSNPSASTRIFKRSFIGKHRFNEKKDACEDEDFTRKLGIKLAKSIAATEYMYFYRTEVPQSNSKRFLAGECNTKRIAYYYDHVTKDMTFLIDEFKREDETNEVYLLTWQNDLPELEQYCRLWNPSKCLRAWEGRGEPTDRIIPIPRPKETQIVIYTSNIYNFSGIDSFTYNFCKAMHKHYDILVVYDNADPEQLARLMPFVPVYRNNPAEVIKCDTLINNRINDKVPQNIRCRKMFQMVHGCKAGNPWHIPQNKGQIICVSEVAKDSFEEQTEDALVVKNLVEKSDTNDMLLLVSATRLDTSEKGRERMLKLARLMQNQGIAYTWLYFSNNELKNAPEGVIHMKPTLDIRKYFKKADYVVQLSDTEAFCYTLVESLLEGTPVICTDIPILKEIGVKDGENAHVIPLDLDGYDTTKFLDIPSFTYTYNNGLIVSKWKKLLGNTTPTGSYKPEPTMMVEITKQYRDIQLDRVLSVGELVIMTESRAKKVQGVGYGIIKEG